MKIAVCGFQHETNTFSPTKTNYDDFADERELPELKIGPTLLELENSVVPTGGAIRALKGIRAEIVPLSWCFATPSGPVSNDAFERILGCICAMLAESQPVDGVFVELHGAMVTEDLQDGDGEVLRRIRQVVGQEVPIAVSLDLHANITQTMFDIADFMDAYRRYPHIDMSDTGERIANVLIDMVKDSFRPQKAMRKLDFLLPLSGGCTDFFPARTLYCDLLPEVDDMPGITGCSFAAGFPFSDIVEVGPSAIAYAQTPEAAQKAADRIADWAYSHEGAFMPKVLSPIDAVEYAQRRQTSINGPIILADTQDNPGAGGPGDTVGLLKAMIASKAKDAVFATLIDEESARFAFHVGVGRTAEFFLGGKTLAEETPLRVKAEVQLLKDAPFVATGPMFKGLQFNFGKMALLRTIEGVRIVVGSYAAQTADQSILRNLELDPSSLPIIALKSSTHFRADFAPIAQEILLVDAPGIAPVNPAQLSFSNVPSNVRLQAGACTMRGA